MLTPESACVIELAEALDELSRHHPNYSPRNPVATADTEWAFIKEQKTGERYSEEEIENRVKDYITVVKSRTAQVINNGDWQLRVANDDHQFVSSARTLIKTLCEIVVAPADRIAVQRHDELMDIRNLSRAMDSIIIDPRLVTDNLLTALGLTALIPQKGDDAMAKRAEAIPHVREILMSLEPLRRPGESRGGNLKYFRMMRITKGPNRGYILGTEVKDGQKRFYKTDLYGALRRPDHINDGYDEERELLDKISRDLDDVHEALGRWNEIKDTDEPEKIERKLEECEATLKGVRNKHKRGLLKEVKTLRGLTDSRGRKNPGALRAKLTKLPKIQAKRLEEMEGIGSYVSRDKTRAHELVVAYEKPIKEFLSQVEAKHAQFIVFGAREFNDANKRRVGINLLKLRRKIQNQVFEPNRSFAWKLARQIDNLIVALDKGIPRPQVGEKFMALYLLAKLKRYHSEIMELLKDISLHPDLLTPQEALSRLETAHTRLTDKTVALEITTPQFGRPFGRMKALHEEAKAKLEQMQQPNSDTTFEDVKETLKNFNFQLFARRLP